MRKKLKRYKGDASEERVHNLVEEALANQWLNLGDTSKIQVKNPFDGRSQEDIEFPHLYLLRFIRDPANFAFTCKHILNIEIMPFQGVILRELWDKPFPMLIASRGAGKSYILGVYAILRGLINQGAKICIVGAAFRQSKVIFEYCENIWANAPVLRDLFAGQRGRGNRENGPRRDIDRCEMILGDSVIYCIPLGDGQKLRGMRSSHTIVDECPSIPIEIYEKVIQGFGAVSLTPLQNVKDAARRRAIKRMGAWTEEQELIEKKTLRHNQAIMTGSASYSFNHFTRYWLQYKQIIESRGDRKKLAEVFGGEHNIDPTLNWRDFSVTRIPYDLLPEGFMDEKNVGRAKATVNSAIFWMEYCAVPCNDSDGFFKRSLIESCVVGKAATPIVLPSGEVNFSCMLTGNPRKRYIFAVDPAAVQDNFSIIILEVWPDNRRVVYCWTTNKASHKAKIAAGLTHEQDFYHFCARKIRNLMRIFPCEGIAMDAQGGGIAVEEALHDTTKLEEGELPIWQFRDPDRNKWKPSDDMPGPHLLQMVEFANAKFTTEANHTLRKDLEDKTLLFPQIDPVQLGLAIEEDKALNRVYDTLEDVALEIELTKDELSTIVVTATPSGREHWDVPSTKGVQDKKGRLRKDRYSALLMANFLARNLARMPVEAEYEAVGGFAHNMADKNKRGGPMYTNMPEWMKRADYLSGQAGVVVRR